MTTILNTPELKPASLGGNTWLYQSRGGKRLRDSKRLKKSSYKRSQTKRNKSLRISRKHRK
jgi:hypothetical protein